MNNLVERALAQAQGAFFLCDEAGLITWVNEAFAKLTGYSRDELIGTHLSRFDAPGDAARAENVRRMLLGGGAERWNRRRPMLRKDGSTVTVDVYWNTVRDETGAAVAAAGLLVDVSDEVAALAQRRDWEEYLASDPHPSVTLAQAFAGAPISQFLLDRSGGIIDANDSACELLGLERFAVVGRKIDDFVWDRGGAPLAGDLQLRHAEGRLVWGRAYSSQINDTAGGGRWTVLQLLDITAERKAQQRARAAEADLRHQARHDALTGLLTRQAMLQDLAECLEREQGQARTAVVYADLDNFKEVNDGLSHEAGDQVLVSVARRLRHALRGDDLLARFGGDEFVCVILGVPTPQAALDRVALLADSVSRDPVVVDGQEVQVRLSFGLSVGVGAIDAETMLREADTALHHAKRSGRNRWLLFDERMRRDDAADRDLAARIRTSLARHGFSPWYQPLVDLTDGSTVGYEALARWQSSPDIVLPAREFLKVATENGLIAEIGSMVIEEAVRAAAGLAVGLRISVNAAAQEVRRPGFADEIRFHLRKYGVSGERLVLELPEDALLNSPAAASAIRELADLGLLIYVDDFGGGVSSLTHLRNHPVGGIKLPASLTELVAGDGDDSAQGIVAGLADLAERLGIDRVAKGIAEPGQRALMRDLGWERGQGMLLGEPAPLPPQGLRSLVP